MDEKHLNELCRWFDSYVKEFYTSESEADKNILLKIEHTHKVFQVMEKLSIGEGLPAEDMRIAQTVALLHDVGRFPQYRRWRTFRDRDSDNHARLAIEVIREQALLADQTPRVRLLIEEAVRFHNLLDMPVRLKSDTDIFLRLIRDADKLDIWRVFVKHFNAPLEERASAALLGFPEKPGVSPACLAALVERRIVNLETVNCINDFKLLLISWVYNLNFKTSYGLLREGNFINSILSGLPDDEKVRNAVAAADDFAAMKAKTVSA
jgi:HD domain